MTIGEKITLLRMAKNISQEQLAEKLEVSRQSVSKWEMDQSIPQIDRVLELCTLFDVSCDELLRDDIALRREVQPKTPIGPNRYFGTDGFRGEANRDLTADHAYRVGRFLGWYFSSPLYGAHRMGYRPRIVIGKDTRRSSYMLEYAIVAGLTASGADAYMLHVTTTPSVSYVTRQDEFDCGIMITASHNPFYDNGIKIVNRCGEKLDDATTSYIEAYIDGNLAALGVEGEDLPLASRENIGAIVDYVSGRNRYIGYLISLASHSYKHLRIGLDCANGASWSIAKAVFDALGAQTCLIGAAPDGLNVNRDCGSTHIETLCAFVREQHLDVGFAFDGDADRCIAVDESGNVVDGDAIMYLLAVRMKSRGVLDKNTVVTTVMSNSGLFESLEKIGIRTEQTKVGDRFVYERMQERGYMLGGEQSGHIILRKYATTGDAILTAITVTEEICDRKLPLGRLVADVTLYPQKVKSVRVKDKSAAMEDAGVQAVFGKVNEEIGGRGRALLRPSGTEPVIRIMVEAETADRCDGYIERLYDAICKGGHCCE